MHAWEQPSLVDRHSERRGDVAWLRAAWADPTARVLDVDARGGLATSVEALAWQPCTGELPPEVSFLGSVADGPRFSRRVDGEAGRSLRDVVLGVPPADVELATAAVAVSHWLAAEPYCPRCGTLTQVEQGGFSRLCPGCGRQLFPQQDPAMIVAVTDAEDRLLLAHQGSWAPERLSILAGFLEAGESIEQCVHREVMEEAGITVADVAYLASQPWPFPRSLMLGCTARAVTTDVAVDGVEITHAGFYAREQVAEQIERGNVSISSPSVSSWLIRRWYLGPEQPR